MFTVGEVVSILSETGKYTIVSIGSDIINVIDEHGFDLKVNADKVVKNQCRRYS